MNNNLTNSLRLKILCYTSYCVALLWSVTGLTIIGSTYLGPVGFMINIVVGTIFVWLGVFFYLKEKPFIKLLAQRHKSEQNRLYKKVIKGELVLFALALLLGIVLCSAVFSRVFGEGVPVFG